MRRFFLVLGLIFGVSAGFAMEVEEVPNPRVERGSYVQDSAGLLSGADSARLDALAVELEAKTGAELAFVLIDNLGGISVEEFANLLFARYGVGKKNKDNGVLILVARDDRRFRVEVGYGLEGVLPDALCKRLMDQLAVPRFKAGDFGGGVYDLGYALARRIAASEGTSLAEAEAPTHTENIQELESVAASETSSGPPWWKWINGVLLLGFTLLFIAWRTLRLHLSPSLAGRRLALGKNLSDRAGQMIGFGIMGTFFLAVILGSGFPILSLIGGGGLGAGLWVAWRKFYEPRVEAYRRACGSCRKPMRVLAETEDDQWLQESQIDEELAEGMDYEFWHCADCDFEERFDVKLPHASNCSKCGHRSLKTTEKILSEPTYTSKGKKRIDKNCHYRRCQHAETIYKSIPKKTRSSSGSGGGGGGGGGGGSFGGGSSGGGGASGSW